jgi:hypothetical protein
MHNAWDCWATISLSAGSQPWPSNLGPVEIDGKRMFESTGQPWKPWNDDEWATALYRSWGLANMLLRDLQLPLHVATRSSLLTQSSDNYSTFRGCFNEHDPDKNAVRMEKFLPQLTASALPSWCFHAPKDQGPWRHFARRCGCCPPRYGCHARGQGEA